MITNIIEIELLPADRIVTRPVHQWDIGQIIKVMDAEIEDGTPVDFGNRFMKGGLRAYVIDNQVTIPAPALQQERDLTGYVVITDENSETTVKEIAIPVIPRPKPEDYVDEEIRESTEFQYVMQAVGEVEANAKAAEESANNAAASEQAAKTAKAAAETSATAADTSAKNAADSETAAGNAATAAGGSASSAAGSATAAAASEQKASGSATTAAAKAAEAGNSAAEAKASETNAAASKAAAAGSASAAKSSETNASTSATNAANSASAAKTSETNANTAASTATAKATAAANSATAAANSEAEAKAAQAAAEAAKEMAEEIAGGDYATKTQLNSHIEDSTAHITADERTKWNAKAEAVSLIDSTSQAQANLTPAEILQAMQAGKIRMAIGGVCTLMSNSGTSQVVVHRQYNDSNIVAKVTINSDKSYAIELVDLEKTSNKVTSLSASSTDTQYPSAKCVYDMIGNVETLLAAL